MLFNSLPFLLFFFVVYGGYLTLAARLHAQNEYPGFVRQPSAIGESRRVSMDPCGFRSVTRARPERVEAHARAHRRSARGQEYSVSGGNREALEDLAKLTSEAGLPLYVVNAPIYERLLVDSDFAPHYRAYGGVALRLGEALAAGRVLVLRAREIQCS